MVQGRKGGQQNDSQHTDRRKGHYETGNRKKCLSEEKYSHRRVGESSVVDFAYQTRLGHALVRR